MAVARRKNSLFQERLTFSVSNASTAASTAEKFWTVPTGRSLRLDGAWYNNPTGLAADANNYFTITVKKGSTVMATWSTQTTGNGALVADTPVTLVLSATDSDTVAAAGDVISVSFAKSGTQTLPAGRLTMNFRLV